MIKQYKLRFYNFRLVVFLLAISFIGIQLVGTAADYLRTRQLLGVIIGVVLMLILSLMDYSWLLNFQWIMYGFNIVMLLAVRFLDQVPMVLQDGLIWDLSVSSLLSCPRSSLSCFLQNFLWIMRKILIL